MTEEQFLENINSCKGIINKLVSLFASNYEERQDYAQEIIFQAWKSAGNFKGTAKFSTWLYRLAMNTLIVLNRNKHVVTAVENLTDYERNQSSHASHDAEVLYMAIKLLSSTDKAVITMHLDGFSNEEIAEYMGITTNNLTVKLHRIKEKIKKLCNHGH